MDIAIGLLVFCALVLAVVFIVVPTNSFVIAATLLRRVVVGEHTE